MSLKIARQLGKPGVTAEIKSIMPTNPVNKATIHKPD